MARDFVNYIGGLLSLVGAMENHPSATNEDIEGIEQIKMLLHGREALEIERSLAEADVKQEVLEKEIVEWNGRDKTGS